MSVYRQMSDLVSVVGNKQHVVYKGIDPEERRECRTRPKDLRRTNLGLVEALPCGNFYLREPDLVVNPQFLAEARAYQELFVAMSIPHAPPRTGERELELTRRRNDEILTERFDRILMEHPELTAYLAQISPANTVKANR